MNLCQEISIYQIIYLSLLTLSSLLSIWLCDYRTSMKVFPIVLSISWITEVVVSISYYVFCVEQKFNVLYHIYIPIEYSLLAYFFSLSTKMPTLKKNILLSIPIYLMTSLILSVFILSFYEFPGLNFNIEGILLILWSLIILFNLQPIYEFSILKAPIFWICLGILIFHTGMFLFNGVFNYLFKLNSPLAKQLFQLVNKNLNFLLYICFSIAFVCSHQMKKYYSVQS